MDVGCPPKPILWPPMVPWNRTIVFILLMCPMCPVDWRFPFHFEQTQIWSGWWFGTCFIFPYVGNNNPNWPFIFFRGLESTSWSVGLTEPAASGKHTWLPKIKTFTATASDAFPSYKPRQISGHRKGTRKSEEKKWRKRVPKAIQQWHPAIHWCGQCYT